MEVATIHGHSGLVCLTSGGAPVSPSRTVPVYMSWIMHTEMEWAGYLLETRASESERGEGGRKKRRETREVKGGYERGPEKRIKREGTSISELAKKKDRFAGPRERRWPDVCNAINRQDLTTFVSPKRAERIRQKDLCTRANESEQGMWIIARWEERQRKEKKKKERK